MTINNTYLIRCGMPIHKTIFSSKTIFSAISKEWLQHQYSLSPDQLTVFQDILCKKNMQHNLNSLMMQYSRGIMEVVLNVTKQYQYIYFILQCWLKVYIKSGQESIHQKMLFFNIIKKTKKTLQRKHLGQSDYGFNFTLLQRHDYAHTLIILTI